MICFIILLDALLILNFAYSFQIHKHMTNEEIMDVFQTTHNFVPEYKVVRIKHKFDKETGNGVLQMKFFKEEKTLYLKPTEGLLAGKHTKVWIVERDPNSELGLRYTLIKKAMENIGMFYHDEENSVAISMKVDKKGKKIFDGIIGNNFVIRPIPKRHRFKRGSYQSNFSFHKIDSNGFRTTFDHIVYKKPASKFFNSIFGISSIFGNMDPHYKISSKFSKNSEQEAPDVVYPEIMIILDEKLYSELHQDVHKAVSYILSFWNGVDLRYRSIERPRVRLNIAGIILVEETLPFIKSSILDERVRLIDQIEATKLVADIGRYLYKEKRFSLSKREYDLALFMTGYDLVKKKNGKWSLDSKGIAYNGRACFIRHVNETIESVGAFEDNAGFSGILSAAHELAHLMGVPHDGKGSSKYLGGPGAANCNEQEGYIMSHIFHQDTNKLRFSRCSQESMQYFLNSKHADCLRNLPPKDEKVPLIMPGQYISLDKQCKKAGGIKAYYYNEKVCTSLSCTMGTTSDGKELKVRYFRPAAEGTPCGDKLYCLNGKCVPITTQTVPDFFKN